MSAPFSASLSARNWHSFGGTFEPQSYLESLTIYVSNVKWSLQCHPRCRWASSSSPITAGPQTRFTTCNYSHRPVEPCLYALSVHFASGSGPKSTAIRATWTCQPAISFRNSSLIDRGCKVSCLSGMCNCLQFGTLETPSHSLS